MTRQLLLGTVASSRRDVAPPPATIGATVGEGTVSQNIHVATLPAGRVVGDNIVIVLKTPGTGASANRIATPAGWTLIRTHEFAAMFLQAFSRVMDGTEANTVNLQYGGTFAGYLAWNVWKLSGGWNVTAGSLASGNDNPPNLNLTTVADTLWLAVFGARRADQVITAPPANYEGLVNAASVPSANTDSNGANVRCASAYRILSAAAEDPGLFTMTGVLDYPASMTIGFRK